VAAIGGEDGAEAVASEGFAAVEGLDVGVVREAFPKEIVAVAEDEALEEGSEEVVVTVGEAIGGAVVAELGDLGRRVGLWGDL
jgi:hypothetical protein